MTSTPDQWPVCVVDGCTAPRYYLNSRHGLCRNHYAFQFRRGLIPRTRHAGSWVRPDGYVAVQAADHPLANKNRQALLHRVVAYDAWGAGWQRCWSCHERVQWLKTLRVVHLDGDLTNNDVDNLAPACHCCAILHRRVLKEIA